MVLIVKQAMAWVLDDVFKVTHRSHQEVCSELRGCSETNKPTRSQWLGLVYKKQLSAITGSYHSEPT